MKNPPRPDILAQSSSGPRATPRQKVDTRTRELAEIAGRTSQEVSQADYEQAKRELTGESDLDRQEAILDALPEAKRWDPLPGSVGRQAPESLNEDEDDEGRSETEQLVDDGAEEAGRDRAVQAARAATKSAALAAQDSRPSGPPPPPRSETKS